MLGDILYFVSFYLEQSSCHLVAKHIIVYQVFLGVVVTLSHVDCHGYGITICNIIIIFCLC